MENPSFVLRKIKDCAFEDRPVRSPGPTDVVVAVAAVGICGSDNHYVKHGRIGDFVVESPMVLGHETSGVIHKIGSNVSNLKVGDRVALEPGRSCLVCLYCKTGRYNLCPAMEFAATPPVDGTLARYYTLPAQLCFKLPDNLSFEEGALMEPLSVAVHACRRGAITLGAKVLILGSGPIGLVNSMVAKAMGASDILVADLFDHRLTLAKACGATATLNTTGMNAAEIVIAVEKAFGGYKADVTIECSGAEECVNAGIKATRTGGTLVCVGMGEPLAKICLIDALCREVDIRGSFRYANCYPDAIKLASSGKVDLKALITHRFCFSESQKAFDTLGDPSARSVKIIIRVSE